MLPYSVAMMWKVLLCILLFRYVVVQTIDFDSSEIAKEDNVTHLTTPTGSFHLVVTNLSSGEHLWYIQPPNASHSTPFVTLFFTQLFLHENDAVTVFKTLEDSQNDSNSLIEPIHSQNSSITLYTDLPELVVKLKGTDHTFQRIFNCKYASQNCAFSFDQEINIMHSPLYIGNKTDLVNCQYTYNRDKHHRKIPVFLFDVFNFSSSSVTLEGSTLDGPYNKDPAVEFLPDNGHSALKIHVEMHVLPIKEYFRLQMRMVDSACSQYIKLNNDITHTSIESPAYILDNGTLGDECRWIIKLTKKSEILGVSFTKLDLTNVLDIISINNGANEISSPLLQVTKSNAVQTLGQLIRSSGQYLWISFKPVNYVSKMMANITVHGQGGYFKNQGEISMNETSGNDTVFLLEVEEKDVVLLNMTSSKFSFPATLSIYNGFDKKELLATIHNAISYPILSKSSRMMIIATSFNSGSFTAKFNGVNPGCLHMSTLSDENYILSGNCNKTCQWIIPPQDLPEQSLLLNIQYLSLKENDTVNIYGLGGTKTHIGTIGSNVTHVPQMMFSSATGVMVEVIQKQCVIDNKIALIGHSSFIPMCGREIYTNDSKSFQLTSPLYPDTYPILADCKWNFLTTSKDDLIHITFISFNLAPDHCVKILDSKNKTVELTGSELPEDMFLSGNSSIYFNSSKCSASKSALQLVSSSGFIMNGTVAECGTILEGQTSGKFTIDISSSNKSLCIWKVSVPSSENSVNIINFTVTNSLDKGNYKLDVFDGPSIREPIISNISTSEVWSKRNSLIFVYKRLDVSKPSSTISINYNSLGCNSSMLCENKICLHPDWRCNGVNDCGDFTDERNCESLPVNPKIENSGYSAVAFWLTFVCMLMVGLLLGFGIPILYRKYGNGQYHRFSDISVIE